MRFFDFLWRQWLKGRSRCYRCGKRFRALRSCDEGEIGAFFSRLWDARYDCAACGISFHGGCAARGRSGQAPGSVRVTCPKCGTEASHPLPFKITPYGAGGP
jgi:hypothetical protein